MMNNAALRLVNSHSTAPEWQDHAALSNPLSELSATLAHTQHFLAEALHKMQHAPTHQLAYVHCATLQVWLHNKPTLKALLGEVLVEWMNELLDHQHAEGIAAPHLSPQRQWLLHLLEHAQRTFEFEQHWIEQLADVQ